MYLLSLDFKTGFPSVEISTESPDKDLVHPLWDGNTKALIDWTKINISSGR